MLPPTIEGKEKTTDTWSIPSLTIKDAPRFNYRGFMLDVSRFFLPKEDLVTHDRLYSNAQDKPVALAFDRR